jgi:hypothetical protein
VRRLSKAAFVSAIWLLATSYTKRSSESVTAHGVH